jgi:cysteine desulfurase / selenocysteine lyase
MPSFWNKIRKDFPITKKYIYLDHAAGGPVPLPVHAKIQQYYKENIEESDFAWMKWIHRREEARRTVAKFINAEPEEVSFAGSTSQGMNYAAEMLAAAGPVLINHLEFPSSTVPWLWRRSQMVWQKPKDGKIDLVTLKTLLSPAVKTVVSSFVQYATGYRQDLEALGRIKGKRYLVVNATQGFGALPIDVKKWNADFLCTNSYKWLMGGYGGGIFYVRKELLKELHPQTVGWRSMRTPEAMDNQKLDLKPEASRYELGCPSFPVVFGTAAACSYLMQIGMEKIEKRLLELTDFAIEKLQEKGFEILSPLERKFRSGIVVFKAKDPERLWKRLLSAKIYVSPRGGGIRISPHFYNSLEEIEQFIKAISDKR